MRPTPIPDEEIWDGAKRVVFAAPGGSLVDDKIRPAEVLVDRTELGPRICARVALDPGDLERLANGEPFWVTFLADHLHPFTVTMAEADAE